MSDYLSALPDPLAVPALPPGPSALDRFCLAMAQASEEMFAKFLWINDAAIEAVREALEPFAEWARLNLPPIEPILPSVACRHARYQHGPRR